MIKVSQLRKAFRLYDKPSDRLKEMLLRRPYHRSHVALDGVGFQVEQGQTLGVLGKNGAGKSTLLKILTGVMLADSGHIESTGRMTGLLELGTGFDRNLSGLRNITANGLLLGMAPAEIAERQADIIAFSELGRYIHEPVRTYSSGMVMRLGFSIAIHADPQCFVVDEALSVGDGHFQQKCMRRIREFSEKGGSIIFVSHDLNAVKMICDQALVLDKGKVVEHGSPETAVNRYNRIMAEMDEQEYQIELERKSASGYGTREVTIEGASLLGQNSAASTVASGESVTLTVQLKAQQTVGEVSVGFLIRDRFGQDIYGTNTYLLGQPVRLQAGESRSLQFRFPASIAPGKYTVTLAAHSEANHLEQCYHWVDNLIQFEVAGRIVPGFSGAVYLPTECNAQ